MIDHNTPWFDEEVPPGEVGISRAHWDALIALAKHADQQ